MEILDFVATVVLVTASGALAPGPLFIANLSQGTRSGAKSGLVFSVAHTAFEFTLVMLLALGLLTVADEMAVKLVIGVVGGLVLIIFGVLQIGSSLSSGFELSQHRNVTSRNLFLVGITLTGLNPFFIVWWFTVGAQLVVISLEFASLAGVVFMYVCHVWIDYVWLTGTAQLAKMGTRIVGSKLYKVVLAVFGAVLVYFGLVFLVSSITLRG